MAEGRSWNPRDQTVSLHWLARSRGPLPCHRAAGIRPAGQIEEPAQLGPIGGALQVSSMPRASGRTHRGQWVWVCFGWGKCSGTQWRRWLHTIVKVWNATELHTLNGSFYVLKKQLHRGPSPPLIDISLHSVLVLGGPAVSSLSTSCWTWRKGKGWWTSITVSGSCGRGEWTWCKRRYCAPHPSPSALELVPWGLWCVPTPQSQGEKKRWQFSLQNSLKEKVIHLAAFLSFLPASFCFSFHKQTQKATSESRR